MPLVPHVRKHRTLLWLNRLNLIIILLSYPANKEWSVPLRRTVQIMRYLPIPAQIINQVFQGHPRIVLLQEVPLPFREVTNVGFACFISALQDLLVVGRLCNFLGQVATWHELLWWPALLLLGSFLLSLWDAVIEDFVAFIITVVGLDAGDVDFIVEGGVVFLFASDTYLYVVFTNSQKLLRLLVMLVDSFLRLLNRYLQFVWIRCFAKLRLFHDKLACTSPVNHLCLSLRLRRFALSRLYHRIRLIFWYRGQSLRKRYVTILRHQLVLSNLMRVLFKVLHGTTLSCAFVLQAFDSKLWEASEGKLTQDKRVARVTTNKACKDDFFSRLKDETNRIRKDEQRWLFLDKAHGLIRYLDLRTMAKDSLVVKGRVEVNSLLCQVKHTLQ